MGALTLPATGLVYLDANPIIYTVEKHPVYGPLLLRIPGRRALPLVVLDDLLKP